MKKACAITVLAAVAAFACQDSRSPVGPEPAEEPGVAGPTATVAACPCWDEGQLGTAFPAVHLYREADGAAFLTRFDHANAQQVQAVVRFVVDGPGACELATFGTGGLVDALTASAGLSYAQCEVCSALLVGRATASGFVVRAVEGETAD